MPSLSPVVTVAGGFQFLFPLKHVALNENEGGDPQNGVPDIEEGAKDSPIPRGTHDDGVEQILCAQACGRKPAGEQPLDVQPHVKFQRGWPGLTS